MILIYVLAILMAAFALFAIYFSVRVATDRRYRRATLGEIEARKEEKRRRRARRAAYDREMARRDPNYEYRGSIGSCGYGS